jgi:hypothetical protein
MTTIQHPAWCSPTRCDATDPDLPVSGGAHRSDPLLLDLGPIIIGAPSDVRRVTATLFQVVRSWTTDRFLHLEAAGGEVSLPVDDAATLLAQLADLLAQARDVAGGQP